MSGGGARAAYQVGFLRYLSECYPNLKIPIITGISAGAINAAFLANYPGSLKEATQTLAATWERITPEQVFRVDTLSLARNAINWIYHLFAGGISNPSNVRGLVNTAPLRRFLVDNLNTNDGKLTHIGEKLERGELQAIAISTTSYMTGQTITWTQGCGLEDWQRPNQVSRKTLLTVDHVMGSAAIPIFFPAIKIDNEWHGDGGIRLYAPLSPAIHLGADRILAISTRYRRTREEADQHLIHSYPPPAQIAGILLNTIFLDLLDQDADRLQKTNHLLEHLPVSQRDGLRPIKLFVLRPSVDLGKLAVKFEPRLPRVFRFLLRRQGTRQTSSSDWLSMVMFQCDYLRYLVDLGENDARRKKSEFEEFMA